ncbi:MAG: hypothetical protein ACRDMX_10415 [Solirubrobacteraceae bacterium]
MSARTRSTVDCSRLVIAGAAAALALSLSACGSSAGGRSATTSSALAAAHGSSVAVARASFPASQRLAQPTHLVIAVRNTGAHALPNVAVTICNVTCAHPAPRGEGTTAAAFSNDIAPLPSMANPSRPVWIVTRPPGVCTFGCLGGSSTAASNTWALGRLAPGATATFDWSVTAVTAGRHTVAWEVAPALSGAVLARGRLAVSINRSPARFYVNSRGQIVARR